MYGIDDDKNDNISDYFEYMYYDNMMVEIMRLILVMMIYLDDLWFIRC